MKPQNHVFATFPEFSKLTLADREKWENLIKDYPPISDIAFSSLMTWWNGIDGCRVSQLNNNLVISFWLPGDDITSGLGLIGTHKVDQTLCEIFDWLNLRGDKPRLVHVPEFVLARVRYPELYSSDGERSYDECILSVADFLDRKSTNTFSQSRAKRFLADIDELTIEVRQVNLADDQIREMLLGNYAVWEPKKINYIAGHVDFSFRASIESADELGLENLCIFANGELQSFLLYSLPADPDYAIVPYAKFNYGRPGLFEFCVHTYAKRMHEQGIKFVNIDFDLGDSDYRSIQLTLRPKNFFRKYTITPKGSSK